MIRLTTMIPPPKKKPLKKAYFKGVGEGVYVDPVVNRVIQNNPMKK